MEKFYENMTDIKPEYLLKATPYTKDTRINFDYKLSKEEFFKKMYTERSNKAPLKRENDEFDKKIEYELRDLGNKFAKVSVLNISGYAGSGKTTYLHHLLWTYRSTVGVYEVIDFEGRQRAVEPFVERIARLISAYDDITELCVFFDSVAKKRLFDAGRFKNHLKLLYRLSDVLKESDNDEYAYQDVVESFESSAQSEFSFLSFLFFVDLLLLIFDRFRNNNLNQNPMILAIDNSDSMSDLSQESILLPSLKQFANDCTFFFAANLKNDLIYHDRVVKDIFKNTKLIVFLTTRMATINRYESIDPDWERIYGWISIKLPENYYDHKDILKKRIEYYRELEKNTKSKTLDELMLIGSLANVAYQKLKFSRLFNGNVRYCIERLCCIASVYSESELEEFFALNAEANSIHEAGEGVDGYFLSMILDMFKSEGIYENKLCLSSCKNYSSISLSRIILTILRESGNRYSLYKVFNSLVKLGYSETDICSTVWNMCENGRKVWRRLLVFDLIVPGSLDELQEQAIQFKHGVTDIEKYSELVICTAGLAYMEFVVPHFEFMLSRHEKAKEAIGKSKYQPLFSYSSELPLPQPIDDSVYQFERKIDTVFEGVKACCCKSTKFANKVLEAYGLSRDEFINETVFNYHTIGWDGEIGPKQSYESRLIFRHIGYIEKYRCYLI